MNTDTRKEAVTRWKPNYGSDATPDKNGSFVRASDYDALAAKLAEVTAERDEWKSAAGKALDVGLDAQLRSQTAETSLRMIISHATCGTMEYTGQTFNEVSVQITKIRNEIYEGGKRRRAEEAEALLPHAYRAGVEASAECIGHMTWAEDLDAIRALPTPTSAELLEQLKETGE